MTGNTGQQIMVMGGEIPDLIELYNVLLYEDVGDLIREASEAFSRIQQDNHFRFNTTLKEIKRVVLGEDEHAKLDKLIK